MVRRFGVVNHRNSPADRRESLVESQAKRTPDSPGAPASRLQVCQIVLYGRNARRSNLRFQIADGGLGDAVQQFAKSLRLAYKTPSLSRSLLGFCLRPM